MLITLGMPFCLPWLKLRHFVATLWYNIIITKWLFCFVIQFNFGLVEVVYEWARGMPFANITQLTDVQVSKSQNPLAKMLVRDGHLSLFYLVIKTDIICWIYITPGQKLASPTQVFSAWSQSYRTSNAHNKTNVPNRVVTDSSFQARMMFANKSRAYPRGWPFRCFL
jgi:DSHCT (NUC185) domain